MVPQREIPQDETALFSTRTYDSVLNTILAGKSVNQMRSDSIYKKPGRRLINFPEKIFQGLDLKKANIYEIYHSTHSFRTLTLSKDLYEEGGVTRVFFVDKKEFSKFFVQKLIDDGVLIKENKNGKHTLYEISYNPSEDLGPLNRTFTYFYALDRETANFSIFPSLILQSFEAIKELCPFDVLPLMTVLGANSIFNCPGGFENKDSFLFLDKSSVMTSYEGVKIKGSVFLKERAMSFWNEYGSNIILGKSAYVTKCNIGDGVIFGERVDVHPAMVDKINIGRETYIMNGASVRSDVGAYQEVKTKGINCSGNLNIYQGFMNYFEFKKIQEGAGDGK